MLVDLGARNFKDDNVFNLADYLGESDVLVFNNSKVIPARLDGLVNGKKIEITLHKRVNDSKWWAFAKPSKKASKGDNIVFNENFSAHVSEKVQESGELLLDFTCSNNGNLFEMLEQYGRIPLPPYIRKGKAESSDSHNYQTVYAKKDGSVAAPTAGLHFTEDLLQRIEKKGVKICFVTLHVGAGTFLPVKVENLEEHKMHEEYYEIPSTTADIINQAKKDGRRIIAVGTTSLRTLEASATANAGFVKAETAKTDIFIYPSYKFKVVDNLLTNFHLPKSTLIMLVSAFSGTENIKALYQHAINNEYRFYSYGDCCFLKCSVL